MDFRLLGQIGCGDPQVTVAGRQRALLGLLLVHAPEVVPVERLIEAVWPEERPGNPANALHSRVSKLRRLFTDADVADALVRQGGGYALRVPMACIDARRFETLADEADELLAAGDMAAAAERAAAALSLWSGEALEPFAHEPWARAEATRLQERRLATIEDRAVAELALGHHSRLVAELERHVAAHPLREPLRGQLMLALYRSGRQADALAVYQDGREQLAEELGIDPSPALVALHQDILEQSPRLAPPAAAPPARPTADGGVGGRSGAVGRSGVGAHHRSNRAADRLVGRAAELATLTEAAGLAASGRGTVVFVTGEAGIGKSELLRSFALRSERDGFLTALGRCAEVPGTPAYWPWAQILRTVIDELEPGVLIPALGTTAADVALLVPELADRLPELKTAFGGEAVEDPFRLQHAVSSFLRRVADQVPLVLVVEDVQVADLASVGLLERLTSDLVDSPILLMLSARSAGTAAETGQDGILTHLRHLGTVQRLHLAGLDAGEVAALATARSERPPPSELLRVLHERSGGNPLFVLELLRFLTPGELDDVPADVLLDRLPPALRVVIAARLAELPAATRGCLEAAAVLGREVAAEVVARMLDRPVADVADDLEVAVRAGVLEHPVGDWFGASRFVHALVRETLEAELSPARRAQLHAAAGAALAASGDDGHVAVVAHHLERSVPLTPPGAAVDAMVAAAERSMALLAYDEATATLERALALLERHGADREREIRLWSRQVSLATVSEGFTSPRTRTAVERIRALSGQLGDAPEVVGTLWSQWAYWANRARMALARELADDLLRDGLQHEDAAAMAAGAFAVGQTAFLAGEPAQAADHLERCAQLLADLPDAEVDRRGLGLLAVNGRCALAHPLWLAGRSAEADRAAYGAVDRADLDGADYPAAHTRMFLGWYHAARGDAEQALAWSADAVRRGEAGGFPLVHHLAGAFAGWARAATGDPATGINELWAAMEAMRTAGFTMLRSWHLELLARSLLAAGRDEEALHTARDAVEVAERSGTTFQLATHHLAVAQVLAATGEDAAARRALATAAQVAEEQGSPTLVELIAAEMGRP